jgi:2'-phosphotransferase
MVMESLSRGLSYVLRHGGWGFKLLEGGYIVVEDILNHPRFKNYSEEDIRRIVVRDAKGRFSLSEQPTRIRANQGHTISVVDDGTLMTRILNPPEIFHGTTMTNWYSIKIRGLSRMRRNQIHFCEGRPGDAVGLRSSSSVAIVINVGKAMSDGIEFYRSRNNVILSSGNSEGIIEPKYFKKVINLKTNDEI